jgi:hypothetical protein
MRKKPRVNREIFEVLDEKKNDDSRSSQCGKNFRKGHLKIARGTCQASQLLIPRAKNQRFLKRIV